MHEKESKKKTQRHDVFFQTKKNLMMSNVPEQDSK